MPTHSQSLPERIRAKAAELSSLVSLAVAGCLCLLFILLYWWMGFDKGSSCPARTPGTNDLWFTGWAISMYCLLFALSWNLVLAGKTILAAWSSISPTARRIASPVVITLVIATAFLLIKWSFGGTHVDAWLKTLSDRSKPIEDKTHTLIAWTPNVAAWALGADLFTVLTVGAITLSLVGLASPPAKMTVEAIAIQMQRFVVSLYSAAALLVFAILEVFMLCGWGASASATTATTLAPATVIVEVLSDAAIFSLFLVAIYAPVSLLQHFWRDTLQRAEATKHPEMDASKWLEANGLSSSPWKSAIAMIAPLVTGALAEIISAILKNAI